MSHSRPLCSECSLERGAEQVLNHPPQLEPRLSILGFAGDVLALDIFRDLWGVMGRVPR